MLQRVVGDCQRAAPVAQRQATNVGLRSRKAGVAVARGGEHRGGQIDAEDPAAVVIRDVAGSRRRPAAHLHHPAVGTGGGERQVDHLPIERETRQVVAERRGVVERDRVVCLPNRASRERIHVTQSRLRHRRGEASSPAAAWAALLEWAPRRT